MSASGFATVPILVVRKDAQAQRGIVLRRTWLLSGSRCRNRHGSDFRRRCLEIERRRTGARLPFEVSATGGQPCSSVGGRPTSSGAVGEAG